jgi:hypothetical protein
VRWASTTQQVVRDGQAALEHVGERGRRPRVLLRRRLGLVGGQVRLQRDPQRLPDRLDFVCDRRHAAQVERHQPAAAHPHRMVGLRRPVQAPLEHARAQVEQALVVPEPAAMDVERFVLDQQPDDLAVGDVDDHLAILGEAVAALAVLERVGLVEAVEVGPGQAAGLALVEVAAQAQVAVGQREDRLRLVEQLEVERGLPHAPPLDREGGVRDHRVGPADRGAPRATFCTSVGRASMPTRPP